MHPDETEDSAESVNVGPVNLGLSRLQDFRTSRMYCLTQSVQQTCNQQEILKAGSLCMLSCTEYMGKIQVYVFPALL